MTTKEKVEEILNSLATEDTIHSKSGYNHTRDQLIALIDSLVPLKTFIVQLKDHSSDFDLLAVVEADDLSDAIAKLATVNEFDPGLTGMCQAHQLDKLTNSFYDEL